MPHFLVLYYVRGLAPRFFSSSRATKVVADDTRNIYLF